MFNDPKVSKIKLALTMDDFNLQILTIRKNASITIQNYIYRVETEVHKKDLGEAKGYLKRNDYLKKIDKKYKQRLVVVRDPIKRVVSYLSWPLPKLYEIYHINNPYFFLDNFEIMYKTNKIFFSHVVPQYDIINPLNLNDFTKVYKFEKLNKLEKKLQKIFNTDLTFSHLNKSKFVSNMILRDKPFRLGNLRKKDINFLIDFYEKDYRFLKGFYDKDKVYKEWKKLTK
jgi:hypothetical protein